MNFFTRFLFIMLLPLIASAQRTIVDSKPTVQDLYAKHLGSIRFSVSNLAFGKLKSNEMRTDTFHMINLGVNPVRFTMASEIPLHLRVKLGQDTLRPGAIGWIAVTFDASKKNDFGFVLDRLVLNTDDADLPRKNLNVTATIEEYFPPLSGADSLLVPRARVNSLSYNFGRIQQGTKISHPFMIYNDGKRDLLIQQAKVSCPCMTVSIPDKIIAPHDSASVKIQFDSTGKEGSDSRKVSLFLNDRYLPEMKLEFTGEVYK